MRNLVSEYASQFRQDRQKQIKLGVVLAALAVLVAGVVFWQLHNTGVAMTNEVFCGQEEHIHDDACYEELLVCDSEDEDHVHDDSCYETVLTCQIPEHTHTVECLIDETADVETAEDWEATLPEELSGIWADDVVDIAESQVGYTESELNFQLAEDGETHQGYTRYGAWYGNEYGDWDAMFVSFCLNYAGVPEEVIPENSGAWALSVALDEESLYIEDAEFAPEAGDLVFFDRNEDGRADTVGIIAGLDSEDGTLTVIEGNSSDAVEENTYEVGGDTIVAFAVLPDQSDEENGDFEIIGETVSLTAEGEDYIVTVTYGENAELPEDVKLVVSEYEDDSETYEDRFAEAVDQYKLDENSMENIRLFNISLMTDGEEVEPAADVQVEIGLIGQDAGSGCSVIHFSGEAQIMETDTSFDDYMQKVTFTVDSFSDFMVLSDYEIMPLAAEAGKLEIFKYDSDQGSGYMEGYYVWVPAGTYLVCYDMINGENGGTETGQFMYVADGYFEEIEGMENWYEATYKSGEWDTDEKYSTVGGTPDAVQIVVPEDGYVYFKFDDNTFHELYAVYLIDVDEAPSSLSEQGSSGGTTTDKKDLRDGYTLYKFEEYTITSTEAGGLSGAVFTLYANSSGDSNAYTGYAYFTDNGDGSYSLVGWCTSYDEETGAPEGVAGDYTCFITTGASGNIDIDGLPNTWVDFTLHEVSAPVGYEPIEDIHFEYNYDGSVGGGYGDNWTDDGLDVSGGTVSVANEPTEENIRPVSIYKYDTGTDADLAGAQFILSRTVEDEYGDVTTEYGQFTYTEETAESDLTYKLDFWSPYSGSALTSGEDGLINIVDLPEGTYTLTETIAPDDYDLLTEPIVFTVLDDGTITIDSGSASYTDGSIAVGNTAKGTGPTGNSGGVDIFKYDDSTGRYVGFSTDLEPGTYGLGYVDSDGAYGYFGDGTGSHGDANEVEDLGNDVYLVHSFNEANNTTQINNAAKVEIDEEGRIYVYLAQEIFDDPEQSTILQGIQSIWVVNTQYTTGQYNSRIPTDYCIDLTYDGVLEGAPLSGASFVVSRNNDGKTEYAQFTDGVVSGWTEDITEASTVTSGTDGYIHIDGLEPGTYTLIETVAPSGYTGSGSITFTVDEDGNVTYGDGSSGTVQVGNTPGINEFPVGVFKYTMVTADGDPEMIGLPDAGFILSRTVTEEIDGVETSATYYASVTAVVEGTNTIEWVADRADATTFTSDENGYINIGNLEPGIYSLIEIEAPDGYMLLTDPVDFILNADGSITGYTTLDNDEATLAVENTAGRELPNTGGMGTWIYTVTGLVLIGGAGALLVSRKRRAVRS